MSNYFNWRFVNETCLSQAHSITIDTQKQKENHLSLVSDLHEFVGIRDWVKLITLCTQPTFYCMSDSINEKQPIQLIFDIYDLNISFSKKTEHNLYTALISGYFFYFFNLTVIVWGLSYDYKVWMWSLMEQMIVLYYPEKNFSSLWKFSV